MFILCGEEPYGQKPYAPKPYGQKPYPLKSYGPKPYGPKPYVLEPYAGCLRSTPSLPPFPGQGRTGIGKEPGRNNGQGKRWGRNLSALQEKLKLVSVQINYIGLKCIQSLFSDL